MTSGKRTGLDTVADSRGVIAALAINLAMRSFFAEAMGMETVSVPAEMFVIFKEAASRILTPHASAILLDPEYGLAAAKQRAKSAGLLLAYEQTGYDKQVRGRMPRLLAGWKAQRLVEAGADSVKLLLYYSTPSSAGVNNARHEFVKRMGAECAAADVPFFLEWSAAEKAATTPARSWLRRNPKSWHGVWRNFLSTEYRVNVLKVGVPVNMAFGGLSRGRERNSLQPGKRQSITIGGWPKKARVPFIYLSQGVSNETFQYALEPAEEAEVNSSGVQYGRATWKDGVAVFVKHGVTALDDWLHD